MISIKHLKYIYRTFVRDSSLYAKYRILRHQLSVAILRKKIPITLMIGMTYRCQCRCVHCSVGRYVKKEKELSTADVRRLIIQAKKIGIIKINFFGGEPMLRKDIFELVRFAYKNGFITSMDSNGILLDEENIRLLKNAGLSSIGISLDSADKQVHNMLRNFECYDKAIAAIRFCAKHMLNCVVNTYASRRAIKNNDLENIIKIAKSHDAAGVKILLPLLSGNWKYAEKERLSEGEVDYVKSLYDLDFVYPESALNDRDKPQKCDAAQKKFIYVSPYGELQLCYTIPISFGNIKIEPLKLLLKRMWSHPISRCGCDGCITNNPEYRKTIENDKNKIIERKD